MSIVLSYLFLLFYFQAGFSQSLSIDDLAENCSSANRYNETIHVGWPYQVNCRILRNVLNQAEWSSLTYNPFNCVIIRNGSIVFNRTERSYKYIWTFYSAPPPQDEVGVMYQMLVTVPDSLRCIKVELHFKPEVHNFRTCNRNMISLYYWDAVGSTRQFDCSQPTSDYPKLPLKYENLSFTWLFNCSQSLPSNVQLSNNNKTLTIPNVDCNDHGIFSCIAQYDGKQRVVDTQTIRVTSAPPNHPPSLTCNETTLFKNEGETANFSCTANYGEGRPYSEQIYILWINETNPDEDWDSCPSSGSGKLNCKLKTTHRQLASRCHGIVETIVYIDLILYDIQPGYYGNYTLRAIFNSEVPKPTSLILTLMRNHIPGLVTSQINIGVMTSILFIFFLIIIIFAIVNK